MTWPRHRKARTETGGRCRRHLSALVRRCGLGRTALRRPVDRRGRIGLLTAILIVLAAIPLSVAVSAAVNRQGQVESIAETADRTMAAATLSEDVLQTDPNAPQAVMAAAQWRARDGATHTGYIPATTGSVAGEHIPIWLDSSGNQVDQPLTADQAYLQGVLAGVCTMATVLALLAIAVAIARYRLNGRRLSAWEAEWRQVEPEWTHRAG
jgi:ABC-type maltose transport system permease subunit